MKPRLLCLACMLVSTLGFGQSKPGVLVGIDLLKPLLSVAGPGHSAYRLVEVTVKIPLSTNYLSIAGGYGQLHSDTIFRNMMVTNRGYYLKVGLESSRRHLVLGWHGLASLYRQSGSYFFRGNTFGGYEAPIPERSSLAVGIEGVLGYQTALSQRVLLRLTGRVTTAALLGPNDGNIPAYFVPGVGHTAGSSLAYSVGVGIHLLYQLHPRPTASSSND